MEGYVCQARGRLELHEVEGGLFGRLQQLGPVMWERFAAASGPGYAPGQGVGAWLYSLDISNARG